MLNIIYTLLEKYWMDLILIGSLIMMVLAIIYLVQLIKEIIGEGLHENI